MAKATINGVELFYDEAGQGEVVLFHHGYTGSHDSDAAAAGPLPLHLDGQPGRGG